MSSHACSLASSAVVSSSCDVLLDVQVIGHHTDFLRKVLKGCLLSRKLTLLQSLVQLKKQAGVFTQLSAALHIQPESEKASDLDMVPAGHLFSNCVAAQFLHFARPSWFVGVVQLACTLSGFF